MPTMYLMARTEYVPNKQTSPTCTTGIFFFFLRHLQLLAFHFSIFYSEKSESNLVMSDSLKPPTDYTDHGVLQARVLDWVAVPFSKGSSQLRDQTQVSHIAGASLPAEPRGKPLIQNP